MRIASKLERESLGLEPKSKCYIVPEGEKTEIQYFCGVRDNSIDLDIKSLIDIIPVENDDEEKGQSHPKEKIDKEEMLRNERRQGTRRGKRFLELKVSEIFGCSKKNIDFEQFKPNIRKAIKNEKCFCEDLHGLKNELGSYVGKLIESLMK